MTMDKSRRWREQSMTGPENRDTHNTNNEEYHIYSNIQYYQMFILMKVCWTYRNSLPSSFTQISYLIVVKKNKIKKLEIEIDNTQGFVVCTCGDTSLFLVQCPLGPSFSFKNTERSHYYLTHASGMLHYSHNFTGMYINKPAYTQHNTNILTCRCSVSWTSHRVFSGLVHCLCTSYQKCLWPRGFAFLTGALAELTELSSRPPTAKTPHWP